MITLYTFGPALGLPDPSPFVVKAMVLLKMAGLEYQTDGSGFRRAPKGKLPYINDDGTVIADSTFIRWHIEKKYHFDFDRGLAPEARGIAWSVEKMLEDNLYWALIHTRWMDDENFARGPANFFKAIPAPVRPLVQAMVRKQVRKNLSGHGMGRHAAHEILMLATKDLDAVAAILGEKPYLLGDEPCGADAAAYALIESVLCAHFTTPLRNAAEAHANLVAYVKRMRQQYLPV